MDRLWHLVFEGDDANARSEIQARVGDIADIDFFIQATRANAERLYHVLCEFGFGDSLDGPEDLLKEQAVFMLGRQPFRIDLLNQIDGVEFAGAWERRVVSELDGISVPFISLEDYVANKRAAGRKKDAYDLEALGIET